MGTFIPLLVGVYLVGTCFGQFPPGDGGDSQEFGGPPGFPGGGMPPPPIYSGQGFANPSSGEVPDWRQNQPKGPFSGVMGPREFEAQAFLKSIESQASLLCGANNMAGMQSDIDVSPETANTYETTELALNDFAKSIQDEINNRFPWWRELNCFRLWRQFRFLSLAGPGAVATEDVERSIKIKAAMSSAFAKAAVCDYEDESKCDIPLEPDLLEIFKLHKDYDELQHYWTAWHDKMSASVSAEMYSSYIHIANKLAQANGFDDMGQQTADAYNDFSPEWTFELFQQQMADSWAELKPYYMKLHAYVRLRLTDFYGPKITHPYGYMPAHIFGNVWSQEWDNLDNITKPYPELPPQDATNAMLEAGFTVERLFQEAEKFFVEMGLFRMTPNFWQVSVVVAPVNGSREMICHPSANEMCTQVPRGEGATYIIKMCTEVNQYMLGTVHHEMGHVQYYMHYAHQPYAFRDGANPGFHEAIGDAIGLSVETPKHLQCALGLNMGFNCDENEDNLEEDINFLYYKSLNKFPMLPFSYALESWKWEVASQKIMPDRYNARFWEIRRNLQGVVPPVERAPDGFDPGAKFHIISDIEYIRYYWSELLVFQFYQAMCIQAGEYNPNDPNTRPLFKCDISGNLKAGRKLAKMLSYGMSIPWPDILEEFTGSRTLDASATLNYFKPLFDWLDVTLEKEGEIPCFGPECEF